MELEWQSPSTYDILWHQGCINHHKSRSQSKECPNLKARVKRICADSGRSTSTAKWRGVLPAAAAAAGIPLNFGPFADWELHELGPYPNTSSMVDHSIHTGALLHYGTWNPPTPAYLWPRRGGAWDHRRCAALLRAGLSIYFASLRPSKLVGCTASEAPSCYCPTFPSLQAARSGMYRNCRLAVVVLLGFH